MRRFARRGQYALMLGIGAVPVLGSAAVSVDLTMVSVHESEVDAVAYAAAHSAIVAYGQGKTLAEAQAFAEAVVAAHPSRLDGTPYALRSLTWGSVDGSTGALVPGGDVQAVSAEVARAGQAGLGLRFGQFLGLTNVSIAGTAISDQIPSTFDHDGCEFRFVYEGPREGIKKTDFSKVVSHTVVNSGPSGWYHLYKDNVAESGSSQRNESAYFRVYNSTNPEGKPLQESTNCGDEYVVRDYDNGGKIPDRVYIGTFYLSNTEDNQLDMGHYCHELKDACPQHLDPYHECGKTWDSVHFDRGTMLCGEPL